MAGYRDVQSSPVRVRSRTAPMSPAYASTTHWRDTVTCISNATDHNSCIMFQTIATGGVSGLDNSGSGDTGATGYTAPRSETRHRFG